MILEDWPGRADPFFVGYDVVAGRIAFEDSHSEMKTPENKKSRALAKDSANVTALFFDCI